MSTVDPATNQPPQALDEEPAEDAADPPRFPIINDEPTSNPRGFHFPDYAKALSSVIADPETRTPLTIGVHGGWGSGKTSLMLAIKKRLDEEWERLHKDQERPDKDQERSDKDQPPPRRACRTVWFNAWKHSGQDAILAALIEAVFAQMRDEGWWGQAQTIMTKVWDSIRWHKLPRALAQALSAGAVDLKGLFDLPEYRQQLSFYSEFQRVFNLLWQSYVAYPDPSSVVMPQDKDWFDDRKYVLVVFIDDLDRCALETIPVILETIKLFLDEPGCVFVLGMDPDVVGVAIGEKYKGQVEGSDYLEKIVQVPFRLRPLLTKDVEEYIRRQDVGDTIKGYAGVIAQGIEPNPRQIKRCLNTFSIQLALARTQEARTQEGWEAGSQEEKLLAKWTVLDFGFAQLMKDVEENPWLLVEMEKAACEAKVAREAQVEDLGAEGWPDEVRPFLGNSRLRDILEQQPYFETEETVRSYIYRSEMVRARGLPAGEAVPAEPRVREPISEMVRIKAGSFLTGEDKQEAPPLPAYRIDRYPVTNRQYADFVRQADHPPPPHWPDGKVPLGYEDHPVVNVTYADAQAYAACRGKRLPTEEEWERAARFTDGRRYPWGDEWLAGMCNSQEADVGETTPVTRYPNGASADGCYDMVGNVWEWTSSSFDGSDVNRVLRGGAYDRDQGFCTCAYRGFDRPERLRNDRGFRCANDAAEA